MRKFRWWLSGLLRHWSYAVEPDIDRSIDLGELIRNSIRSGAIEPHDTPLLRQWSKH